MLGGKDLLDAGVFRGILYQVQGNAFTVGLFPGHGEKEKALFLDAVDDEKSIRDGDAGEIVEIVALPEKDVAGRSGRTEEYCDPIRDLVHQPAAASGVFPLIE